MCGACDNRREVGSVFVTWRARTDVRINLPTTTCVERAGPPPIPEDWAVTEPVDESLGRLAKRRRQVHEAVRRWQQARVADGGCRQCGNRLAEGSRSRCLAHLEHERLRSRQRLGIPLGRRVKTGRPLIGDAKGRRRDLQDEQARRERRRQRAHERSRHELYDWL